MGICIGEERRGEKGERKKGGGREEVGEKEEHLSTCPQMPNCLWLR